MFYNKTRKCKYITAPHGRKMKPKFEKSGQMFFGQDFQSIVKGPQISKNTV